MSFLTPWYWKCRVSILRAFSMKVIHRFCCSVLFFSWNSTQSSLLGRPDVSWMDFVQLRGDARLHLTDSCAHPWCYCAVRTLHPLPLPWATYGLCVWAQAWPWCLCFWGRDCRVPRATNPEVPRVHSAPNTPEGEGTQARRARAEVRGDLWLTTPPSPIPLS